MKRLLDFLPMIMSLSGGDEDVREQAVFSAFRAAAGDGVANACKPCRLTGKCLSVAVIDRTWKKQMEALAGEYVFKVNSLLMAPVVTFIEFEVDADFVSAKRPAGEKSFEFRHTPELEDELKPAASVIEDERLRERFLRAAARSLERKGE